MGLFSFLQRKPKEADESARFALQVFPGGSRQFERELAEFSGLLDGALPNEELRFLLGAAKSLLFTAKDKRFIRCRDYLATRSGHALSDSQLRSIYEFMCTKLSIAPDYSATQEDEDDEAKLLLIRQLTAMRAGGVAADEIPNGHGPFALCKTNPVPTSSIEGSERYLARLRTHDGRVIEYRRLGSTSAREVTNGAIDIYALSVGGKYLLEVFICPYHQRDSERAPDGFRFA
jgi:hypothetical protein